MTDYKKLKVADLRKILVDEHGWTEEQADGVKGKPNLIYEVKKARRESGELPGDDEGMEEVVDAVDFDDTVENDESSGFIDSDGELPEDEEPTYTDPDWSDYVMSYFRDEDLADGKSPTCAALRRVAEKLLGEIVFSGAVDVQATNSVDKIGRATVVYEIKIAWVRDLPLYVNPQNDEIPLRTYRGVADSWINNTDKPYVLYPAAIAETRAEARALRKALRISNVIAAEEWAGQEIEDNVDKIVNMSRNAGESAGEWDDTGYISNVQKITIKKKCADLGIDPNKFINKSYHEGNRPKPKYQSIDEVEKNVARHMIKVLNQYQSDTKQSKDIPEEIKLKENNDEG